jgi:hypothetical protein
LRLRSDIWKDFPGQQLGRTENLGGNAMIKGIIVAAMFMGGTGWAFAEEIPHKPNPEVTYGDYCTRNNPDYDGDRYEEGIAYCRRNVSTHKKMLVYEEYNVPEKCKRNYTVDHFIPLALGGSNAEENLWPEHKKVKATRQDLEQETYDQLRRGEITRKQAVEIIVNAKMNPPPIDNTILDPEGCAH